MSSSVRDFTESTEAEGRDDMHQHSHCTRHPQQSVTRIAAVSRHPTRSKELLFFCSLSINTNTTSIHDTAYGTVQYS